MWPGQIPADQTIGELMMTMDLFPTFLSAAGIDADQGVSFDGVNLLPTLTKGTYMPERTVFWDTNRGWAARRGNWKVVGDGKGSKLYNLLKDLGETDDLSEHFKDTKKELTEAYEGWKKATKAATPVS
jgi:arylsulfatase A-like enzyme